MKLHTNISFTRRINPNEVCNPLTLPVAPPAGWLNHSNCWMDCYEFWFRHLCPPQDNYNHFENIYHPALLKLPLALANVGMLTRKWIPPSTCLWHVFVPSSMQLQTPSRAFQCFSCLIFVDLLWFGHVSFIISPRSRTESSGMLLKRWRAQWKCVHCLE